MNLLQPISDDPHARLKQEAAEYAVRFVQSGMKVGLGTGSTAYYAVLRIGELIKTGVLRDIVGFPTSQAAWRQAQELGIPLIDDSMPHDLDITIDGADEVDPRLNLIKGGGGALFREKIVAQASAREIIAIDESKLSPALGSIHPLPVEVSPFGWRSQLRFLESLGARAQLRQTGESTFLTDSGNFIFDCDFGPIVDPQALANRLTSRAGIIEHGMFIAVAADVIVAGSKGVRHLQRASEQVLEIPVCSS